MADLDLSKKGSGDLRLGSEPAINQSDVRPIATRSAEPLIDFTNAPGRSLALVAGDFLSGFLGQGAGQVTAGAVGARQRAEQLKNQRLMRSLELGANLAKAAQAIPEGPKRDKYLSTIEDTLAKAGDKDTIGIVRSMVFDHPDVDFSLYENVPEFKALVSTGATPAQQVAWMQSKEGLAAHKEHQTATVTPVAMDKLSAITQDIDKLHREGLVPTELYKRVTRDGKMTFQDAIAISNALPEAGADQYRLEPNEISAATGAADQWATAGLATAEDFETEGMDPTSSMVIDSKGNHIGNAVKNKDTGKFEVQIGDKVRPLKDTERVQQATVGLTGEDVGLSKKTRATLEESVFNNTEAIARLEQARDLAQPEFFGLEGDVLRTMKAAADYLGLDLPEGADEQTTLDALQAGIRNDIIKFKGGSAVTESEAKRLELELMNSLKKGHKSFLSALDVVSTKLKYANLRARHVMQHGFEVEDFTLSQIEHMVESGELIDQRLAQLNEQKMGKKAIMATLRAEFPVEPLMNYINSGGK